MVINFSSYSRYLLSILIHFLFFLILLIPKYQNDAMHNKKSVEFNINFLNEKKNIVQQEAYIKDKTPKKKKAKQNIQKSNSVKKEEEKKLVTKDTILENKNTKSENNSIQTSSNLINNIKKNKNIDSKNNALEAFNDYNNKASINEISPKVNDFARESHSVNSEKSHNQSINKTQKKEAFNSYNNYLKKSIQIEASKNYPRRSIRNNEEGKVVLIFSLDKNGLLKKISIGEKTVAPKRLIEAAKKTLEKLSPFKKNTILTNYNVFSIAIVYKLN